MNKTNLFSILALCLVCSICLTSCSNEDENVNNSGEITSNVNIASARLYGTWEWESDYIRETEDGETFTFTNDYANTGFSMTFNENGTCIQKMDGYDYMETWSLQNGNKLIFSRLTYTITSFTGDKMTIEGYDNDDRDEYYERITFRKKN
ncbi:MAG: hypothetical protein NC388_10390 [Clostridium sp.]|nr:hypothetical protein [Clostridium sp.]